MKQQIRSGTLVHASGIHATIAGVALGLLTRVRPDPDEHHSPAERLEHRLRPLSAAVAVPIFAFFSTGVVLSAAAFEALANDRVAYGIVLGLVLGKFVGVFGGTWLAARLTRAELSDDLAWRDIAAVGLLAGIGFTVSLLITELAFEDEPGRLDLAKTAVLVGSVVSALIAALVLRGPDVVLPGPRGAREGRRRRGLRPRHRPGAAGVRDRRGLLKPSAPAREGPDLGHDRGRHPGPSRAHEQTRSAR